MGVVELQSEEVGRAVGEFKVQGVFCFFASKGSWVQSQVCELVFEKFVELGCKSRKLCFNVRNPLEIFYLFVRKNVYFDEVVVARKEPQAFKKAIPRLGRWLLYNERFFFRFFLQQV